MRKMLMRPRLRLRWTFCLIFVLIPTFIPSGKSLAGDSNYRACVCPPTSSTALSVFPSPRGAMMCTFVRV